MIKIKKREEKFRARGTDAYKNHKLYKFIEDPFIDNEQQLYLSSSDDDELNYKIDHDYEEKKKEN